MTPASCCEEVLADDPHNVLAKRELGYLDDPIRTNPALTYEHTQDIDEVRRTLYIGEGAFNLGKYDEAKTEFEKVLRIDPYNKAARRWLERVGAGQDRLLPCRLRPHPRRVAVAGRRGVGTVGATRDTGTIDGGGHRRPLRHRRCQLHPPEAAQSIVIPVVDFEDTSVEEAIDFLRQRSIELDTLELDPTRKGINFVIRKPRSRRRWRRRAGRR